MSTFRLYKKLLENLAEADVFSYPVASMLSEQRHQLYIKHDVETNIGKAITMAQLEASFGHVATYYFQADFLFTPSGRLGMKAIQTLGHEVAYHYDVLDENEGNYEEALLQFENYLEQFEALGLGIETVCPHGNPTKTRHGWKSNKDFFRHEKIKSKYAHLIDIVVQFPDLLSNGLYVSDAGRKLRIIGDISGNDHSKDSAMNDGENIEWEEIPALIAKSEYLVLSVHPHRFVHTELSSWFQRALFVFLKTMYVSARKLPFVKQLANRFYKLAKKI